MSKNPSYFSDDEEEENVNSDEGSVVESDVEEPDVSDAEEDVEKEEKEDEF